jgi:hypothetical protein
MMLEKYDLLGVQRIRLTVSSSMRHPMYVAGRDMYVPGNDAREV